MFKIEFFVDDKYLAEVLRGVAGKARQLQVIPVVNVAEEKTRGRPNGQLKQDAEHTLGLFLKELKKVAPEQIVAAQARQAAENCGMAPTSYSYFLQKAAKAKLIKKGKKEGNNMIYMWA